METPGKLWKGWAIVLWLNGIWSVLVALSVIRAWLLPWSPNQQSYPGGAATGFLACAVATMCGVLLHRLGELRFTTKSAFLGLSYLGFFFAFPGIAIAGLLLLLPFVFCVMLLGRE